jgi:hypothetical protein
MGWWFGRHELDEEEAEQLGRWLGIASMGGQSLFFALLGLAAHDARFGFAAVVSPILLYVSSYTFVWAWDWWRARNMMRRGTPASSMGYQAQALERWACAECGATIDVWDATSIRLAEEMGWRLYAGPTPNFTDRHWCPACPKESL